MAFALPVSGCLSLHVIGICNVNVMWDMWEKWDDFLEIEGCAEVKCTMYCVCTIVAESGRGHPRGFCKGLLVSIGFFSFLFFSFLFFFFPVLFFFSSQKAANEQLARGWRGERTRKEGERKRRKERKGTVLLAWFRITYYILPLYCVQDYTCFFGGGETERSAVDGIGQEASKPHSFYCGMYVSLSVAQTRSCYHLVGGIPQYVPCMYYVYVLRYSLC